jgi:5-methylcytosine-specific restriction protein B
MSFSWISIYEALAKQLLDWRDRQGELIALMRETREAGLPALSIEELVDGVRTPLTEIDPFTCFAAFNRQLTADNRVEILEAMQRGLRLEPRLTVA